MKIRLLGAEFLDAEGRTDGQRETDRKPEVKTDMSKLTVDFSNFCDSALKPTVTVHDVSVSFLILSSYLIFSVPLNLKIAWIHSVVSY
jgi:hypothetical protein